MNLIILVEKEHKENIEGLHTLHEVYTWFDKEPFEGLFDIAYKLLAERGAAPGSKLLVMHYENLFDWIDNTDHSDTFYIHLPPPTHKHKELEQIHLSRTKSVLEKLQAFGHINKYLLINP